MPPVLVTDHGVGVVYQSNFDERAWHITKTQLAKRVFHAVKLAQHIVVVSEFARESLLSALGVDNNVKVTTILNPISPEKWPMLERGTLKNKLGLTGKKILVFSGVHLPFKKKGLDLLLQAVADDEWLRRNCMLIIITREEAGRVARQYMRSSGIKGIVLPPQPQAQLSKYYSLGDVLVVPSRLEGIGLVYTEALISGTPVVGFYKSVLELERELGIYIGEGFNATTEGPKELAEKIKKVLNTRVNRQALRKAVIEKLSWEVKFQEFENVYRKLIRNKQ